MVSKRLLFVQTKQNTNLIGSDVDVLRQPVLFGAKLAPTVAVVQLLDELRQNLSKSRWQHENCV